MSEVTGADTYRADARPHVGWGGCAQPLSCAPIASVTSSTGLPPATALSSSRSAPSLAATKHKPLKRSKKKKRKKQTTADYRGVPPFLRWRPVLTDGFRLWRAAMEDEYLHNQGVEVTRALKRLNRKLRWSNHRLANAFRELLRYRLAWKQKERCALSGKFTTTVRFCGISKMARHLHVPNRLLKGDKSNRALCIKAWLIWHTSQQNIGRLLGLGRSTVNRHIKAGLEDGVIWQERTVISLGVFQDMDEAHAFARLYEKIHGRVTFVHTPASGERFWYVVTPTTPVIRGTSYSSAPRGRSRSPRIRLPRVFRHYQRLRDAIRMPYPPDDITGWCAPTHPRYRPKDRYVHLHIIHTEDVLGRVWACIRTDVPIKEWRKR